MIVEYKLNKLLTMHNILHPSDEVDRLLFTRKSGGKRLTIIKDSVDTETQGF